MGLVRRIAQAFSFRRRVSHKIFLLTSLMLVAMVAVSGALVWEMRQMKAESNKLAQYNIPLIELVGQISRHQLRQTVHYERALARASISGVNDPSRSQFKAANKKFKSEQLGLSSKLTVAIFLVDEANTLTHDAPILAHYQTLTQMFADYRKTHASYSQSADQFLAAINSGELSANTQNRDTRNLSLLESRLNKASGALLDEIREITTKTLIGMEGFEQKAIQAGITITGVFILISILLAWWVGRGIARPLRAVTHALSELAQGNVEQEVNVRSRDEIGEIAKAYESLREITAKSIHLANAQAEEQERKQARTVKLEAMLGEFDSKSEAELSAMLQAADEVQQNAQKVAGAAARSGELAQDVSAAVKDASSSVQRVAHSTEELETAVREITAEVDRSSTIAQAAAAEMQSTWNSVQNLEKAVNQIGEVVDLIADIANQTNLLALNATIEAARAGEAGRGFAVVASEVKELAKQTGAATESIGQQINAIRTDTSHSVNAITTIAKTIEELDAISSTISGAVARQAETTIMIANDLKSAAGQSGETSQSVGEVQEKSHETANVATMLLQASSEMRTRSDQMQKFVGEFLKDIKAA